MRYRRWLANGKVFACPCGGTARGYTISPRRGTVYINHVFVCDNPACRQSVSEDGRRRGRLILA